MKDETRNKKYNMMIEMKKQENKKTIEEKANPKCNKCYGTGNLGWNNTYKYWVVCKCVLKIKRRSKWKHWTEAGRTV
ncbi:hypothetical protein LCGC14_2429490 [marine sediment metagenome]|uniref:Uncharacterized protein n=1 Tax=marine sediment metagenome TaxID=412755 RepID=A0A0F9C9M8_9ZZZZ